MSNVLSYEIDGCEQCGAVFFAASRRAKYCSCACKQRAYRQSKSLSAGRNTISRKPGSGARLVLMCKHCGTKFTPIRSDAKFCKQSCRVMSNRAKQNQTWRLITALTTMTDFEVFDHAAEFGWSGMYQMCSKLDYYYDETIRNWRHDSSNPKLL